MIKLTLENEENYAARFVTLTTFESIVGADKIKYAVIKGYRVIVAADVEAGTKGVFFPVETQIAKEFLSKNNLFSDKMLNADQEKVSYFGDKGRVRCVKLRGAPSEGFFIPLSSFDIWKGVKIEEWGKIEDEFLFDTVNGQELCKKYQVKLPRNAGGVGAAKTKKIPNRMVADQYRLHYSTNKLQDHIHLISPDDKIVISDKIHGTSLNCGRVLIKRELSFFEKIKKFFKLPVQLTEYGDIYASRTVIKSFAPNSDHYYKEDVWKSGFDTIKHALSDGIQIYAEVAGFTPTGSAIQKGWDYGCATDEFKVYVYRVTYTDAKGGVTEYSMQEVVEFCLENKLTCVPIFYIGAAKDLFPELDVENHWHEEFLKKLRVSFNMEKNCKICKNKIPAEGLVLRNDTKMTHALKLKSFNFLVKETAMLDKGEEDIESAESE